MAYPREVSVAANLARVKENLSSFSREEARTQYEAMQEDRHARILRENEAAMREHESKMRRHRHALHENRRSSSRDEHASMRFRFKSSHDKSTHDKSSHHDEHTHKPKHDEKHRKRESRRHEPQRTRSRSPARDYSGLHSFTAHPLARPTSSPPYLDPSMSASASESPGPDPAATAHTFKGPDDAFQASLFDAMADDSAAAYWQDVYGQDIHNYPRPTVETEDGVHDIMTDDEYAAYVKQKMWERKNPHLVREMKLREDMARKAERERCAGDSHDYSYARERTEEYRQEAGVEEGRRRRQEEERRHRAGSTRARGTFGAAVDEALDRGSKRQDRKHQQQVWQTYLDSWERLMATLQASPTKATGPQLAASIPWPVKGGRKNVHNKELVQEFFRNPALGEGPEARLAVLKSERVRWHPDKIQHRFGGDNVDAETLKLVTGVFQTIDDLLALERKKMGLE